jgi:hypothetical protein
MDRSTIPASGLRVAPAVRVRTLIAVASLSVLLGVGVWQAAAREHSAAFAPVRPGSALASGGTSLPDGAQAPVSAALGAADPAYRVSATGGGFRATSPAQRLQVRFGRSGVALSSGPVRLALSLTAIGYGASLRPLGEVAPRVSGNRVRYARGDIEEWYINGPLGLEQGFTLARAPASKAPGPLTLSLALSGSGHASLAPGGQSVTLGHAGGRSLRYGALLAVDAGGRRLHSWLEVNRGALLLKLDTHGARYPLRIDPLVQQGSKLSAEGQGSESGFGYSVAVSADGDTALIGVMRSSGSGGVAWIFTRSGSVWTLQSPPLSGSEEGATSEPCTEEECGFGRSVALSADGNTALIGAPNESGGFGAAWVFTRSGSTWSQQGPKLVGGEERLAIHFGRSVALSADGSTALIGSGRARGAAWVFTRSESSTWSQQGPKLVGADSGEGYFGRSVAISADGNTALIGAPGDTEYNGAAWVFTRSGGEWEQQGVKLTGAEEGGAGRFGFSVALSADASTVLVGGRSDSGGAGAAWVFARSGSSWEPQGAKLTGGGESGSGEFGYSVALSADGNAALVGGPRDNSYIGAAWSFKRLGATWAQEGELTGVGESGKGRFGGSVALSADGRTALVGGFFDNGKAGATWAFQDGSGLPSEQPHGEPGSSTQIAGAQTVTKLVAQSGTLASTTVVLPPPILGVSGNLAPLSGHVFVKLPGLGPWVPLTTARQVPFGTIINATHGKVKLTTARRGGGTQSMTFYAGQFRVTQNRTGLVTSALAGGNFRVCPTARERRHLVHASATHASRKHVVRKLWAEGHGSYSTKGNYATGAVLGTRWLTEDLCEGTLIHVATDKVAVTNLVNHRHKTVKAGHSYLVKAP